MKKKVSFLSNSGRSRTDTEFSVTDEISLFFASCKVEDVDTVQELLKIDPSIAKKERKGTTPLHVAARSGADRVLHAIIAADPESTVRRDTAGFTAFARASEAGRVSSMKILLEARPNSPKDRDLAMFTPLHRAAGNGRVEACKFLIDHNAEIDETDHKSLETALFHACRIGSANVVELLIQFGANVNSFNDSYSTPIFICIQSLSENIGESARVLDLLLEHGAKPNIQNNFCRTPLSLAIELQCSAAIIQLLRKGADPDFAAYGKPFPLKNVLVTQNRPMIQAFEQGLGKSVIVDKLCQLSSTLDPYYLVGKSLHIIGYGDGFCVEAYRPILGLFGPITHTIRFSENGEEKDVILDREGTPGVRFYVMADQNFERPLLPIAADDDDDDDE